MYTKTNLTFKMASLTTKHRRSTRTRREPKRFTDEKFVSGQIDQYTRDYSGWREDKWLKKYQDSEEYYHDHRNRKFATVNWINSKRYRVHLRDFPESLLEFVSIWRDYGLVMPSDVLDKLGSYLRISAVDQALLVDDDTFITADHDEDCEEIDHSDEEAMSDGEFYSSEDDEGWSGSDDEHEGKYWAGSPYLTNGYGTEEEDDNINFKCGLKSNDPSTAKKVSFSSSDDEIHETYSSKEYNRSNSDFYDAIRRRDRVDKNWRRMIMRVYAPLLR